jgi:hypothetical protein
MPVVLSVFAAVLILFQLFFRYDTWHSENQDGLVYERDRLSGETHLIHPGQKIALTDRILGIYPDDSVSNEQPPLPQASVSQTPARNLAPIPIQAEPQAQDSTEASTKPQTTTGLAANPVQQAAPSKKEGQKTIATEPTQAYQLNMVSTSKPATTDKLRNSHAEDLEIYPEPQDTRSYPYDLNHDGSREQIIQSVTANDGLLDISVTQSGREVLFTRGKQLQILPSKQSGWADLALMTQNKTHKNWYRFDRSQQTYVLIGTLPIHQTAPSAPKVAPPAPKAPALSKTQLSQIKSQPPQKLPVPKLFNNKS